MPDDGYVSWYALALNPLGYLGMLAFAYILWCGYQEVKHLCGNAKARRELPKLIEKQYNELRIVAIAEANVKWAEVCLQAFGSDYGMRGFKVLARLDELHERYVWFYWRYATRGVSLQFETARLQWLFPWADHGDMMGAMLSHHHNRNVQLKIERERLLSDGIPPEYLHVTFRRTLAVVS